MISQEERAKLENQTMKYNFCGLVMSSVDYAATLRALLYRIIKIINRRLVTGKVFRLVLKSVKMAITLVTGRTLFRYCTGNV